ncbi:hypothetical protein [Haloferula sp. BvORR071]|uniref:hypothetical protein n=1 Tax=Haloferula sp. BvORR071 TaxID=1396141 RepID=UPI000557C5E2|nr:hypothetical protein [Haloferula sp. BvORR071]
MRTTLLAISLISLGATSGYGIKRALAPGWSPSATTPAPKQDSPAPTAAPPNTHQWQIPENRPPSEIAVLPPGAMRTAETVLWLPNATPEELRAFWRQLVSSKSNDNRLKNLLLDRWMRIAPDDALKETAGTEDEYLPWVAWGKIDPELGVREAKARKSGYLWRVLQGAGWAQPELAKKLLAENPGYDYPAVTGAIGEGFQNVDWQTSLEYQFDSGQLAKWARYEPARAFEWALENTSRMGSYSSPWKGLVEEMLDQEPAKLDAAIAELPAGKLRSEITVEKARALAASDPAAVMAMADAAEPGGPRNRLLAIAGPALLESDPAKSLALLREFAGSGFTVVPVIYPNGSSSNGSSSYNTLQSWVLPLLKQDPAGVIDVLPRETQEQAMQSWRSSDRDGFVQWVSTLSDEAARDGHYSKLAQDYRMGSPTKESFSQAMEWTAKISNQDTRTGAAQDLMQAWYSLYREQTTQYFGPDGPAAADQKAEFQRFIESKGGRQ